MYFRYKFIKNKHFQLSLYYNTTILYTYNIVFISYTNNLIFHIYKIEYNVIINVINEI